MSDIMQQRQEIERAEIRRFFIKYAQEDEAKRERCKRIAFWQMWVGVKSNDSRGGVAVENAASRHVVANLVVSTPACANF
jgi:hypothetical protein